MKRESMIVRVPVQTKNDIAQIAKEQGVTVNGLVNHLFYELVEKYKQKGAKGGEADERKSTQNRGANW